MTHTSLLALKLWMTPIRCGTKSKQLSIDFRALYYLAPIYFPSLVFPILSSPIQESYVSGFWTSCYSHSLGLADIGYSTGNVLSIFSVLWPSISLRCSPVSPEGINLLPFSILQHLAYILVVVLIPFCFVLFCILLSPSLYSLDRAHILFLTVPTTGSCKFSCLIIGYWPLLTMFIFKRILDWLGYDNIPTCSVYKF